MYKTYLKIIESSIKIDSILSQYGLQEKYPTFSPYTFFEVIYLEAYSNYKRRPDAYNKGALDGLWKVMVEMLGARAKTIKNQAETRYASNRR